MMFYASLSRDCMFADGDKTLLLRQFVIGSSSAKAPKDLALVCRGGGGE